MNNNMSLYNICKYYSSYAALNNINIRIDSGEFMTLLGPSGSGKTTMLMIIAGFVEPSSGTVSLDGTDITKLPPERRDFGLVFQGYALFPHMSVWENVYFPLRVRGISRSDATSQVNDALELIQLSHLSERNPRQLSGGQQQRVALARAMVFKPELLLLDEPLSALDRALRKDMQIELKALHQRVGTTFVYVTHDQEEALSMSDRIAILHDGEIEQSGTPEELYENPSTVFVADFLGKNNFLPVADASVNSEGMTYIAGGHKFMLRRQDITAFNGEFCVAIRPERLKLYTERSSGPDNMIPGSIREIGYFGQNYEVVVATESVGDLVVSANLGGKRPRIGEQVWIGWDDTSGVPLPGRPSKTGEVADV